MRTMLRTAAFGAAAVALLTIPPTITAADAHGGGGGFHGHFGHADYHHHGVVALWGSYVVLPPAAPAPQPSALSCRYSEQTVTVPAEAGGTRDITINRCGGPR